MKKISNLFIWITIGFVMINLIHTAIVGNAVYGDGNYYFSWLRSIVIDHDISFANEYLTFSGSQPSTPVGKIGNIYAIGPAMIWSQFYLITHSVFGGAGYELPYQIAVSLSGVLSVVAGLVLVYITLEKYFSKRTASLSMLLIATGTNLLFYGAVDTANSHPVSFLAASTFVSLLYYTKDKNWLAIGATLGAITLMRTQDVIYGLLLLPYLRSIRINLQIMTGFVITIIPMLVSWHLLYGAFWKSPYAYLEGYYFQFTQPQISSVLFSTNGLFLWTPAIALAVIGLALASRRKRLFPSRLFLGLFLLQLYIVASWSTWWQGASFSGRMFVSLLPVFGFGFGWLIESWQAFKHHGYRAVLLISAANSLAILHYLQSF